MAMKDLGSNFRHSNNFDLLRFIAALVVILAHSYYLKDSSISDPLRQLTNGAIDFPELGLSIFFIISGFLITGSLIRSRTAYGYLWKRALRIFPGLLFALLFSVFLVGPLVTEVSLLSYFTNPANYEHLKAISLFNLPNSIPDAFTDFSCRTINGSLWTLPYEFFFYILVLLLFPIKKFRLITHFLILVAFLLLTGLRIYLNQRLVWYDYHTPFLLGLRITSFMTFSTYFSAGMVIYIFRNELNIVSRPVLHLILGVMLIGISSYFAVFSVVKFIFIPLITCGFAYLPGRLNDFGKFGDYSYGLYIYAYPIQQTLMYFFREVLPVWLFFFLASVVTFVFAYLSWHFVEKRALNLKGRFD